MCRDQRAWILFPFLEEGQRATILMARGLDILQCLAPCLRSCSPSKSESLREPFARARRSKISGFHPDATVGIQALLANRMSQTILGMAW